jgi:hypothetical protein
MLDKNLHKMQQRGAPGELVQIGIKKATKRMVKLVKHPKVPKMPGPGLEDLRLQPHDLFSLQPSMVLDMRCQLQFDSFQQLEPVWLSWNAGSA